MRRRCERLEALCRKLGVPPAGTAATDATADDELALQAGALHAALVRHPYHAEAVQAVFTCNRALFETVELAGASLRRRAHAERCLAAVRASAR